MEPASYNTHSKDREKPAGLCRLEGLPNGPWQLTVIDLKGRLLLNTAGDGSSSLLDISSLTTGIYIIRIQDSTTGKTAHERIILK